MGLRAASLPTAPARVGVGATPALALVLGLLAAAPALAQQQDARLHPPRQAPPIGFHVLVAHASDVEGETDPECRIIKKRILPMQFGSIRAVHQRDYWTGFGDLINIELPGADAPVQLRPMAIHERQLHMQVQLPGRMDSRLRLNSGHPVILGGVPHPEGGYLIIQVEPDFGRHLDPNSPARTGAPETIPVNSTPR